MVIPVLLLVGCTDQQNQAVERQAVEQEPWGTVVERNLVCTDFMQRVGAVYEFRDDEDKPKTLWNDDCFIEQHQHRMGNGLQDGNEWQMDTKWILKIRRFDGGDDEYVEWTFRVWRVIEWDEDGVPLYEELQHTDPKIGSTYYPDFLRVEVGAEIEQTPVRWPPVAPTVVAAEQDDKGD